MSHTVETTGSHVLSNTLFSETWPLLLVITRESSVTQLCIKDYSPVRNSDKSQTKAKENASKDNMAVKR